MEQVIYILFAFCLAFGIPAIFLVSCIKNILKMVKAKKDNVTVEGSWIIQSMIYGFFFVCTISGCVPFFLLALYSISK